MPMQRLDEKTWVQITPCPTCGERKKLSRIVPFTCIMCGVNVVGEHKFNHKLWGEGSVKEALRQIIEERILVNV